MHTLLKNKEFIQGMALGNCPNPDNEILLEVVEAAKEFNIVENWVCTCEPSFDKWVKDLVDYCEANIWNELPVFKMDVNDETNVSISITNDSLNPAFVPTSKPKKGK